MASSSSRIALSSGARALNKTTNFLFAPTTSNAAATTTRSFHRSAPRLYADAAVAGGAAAPLPPRKPMGAFRGGLFGFLFGATLAGSGSYYYILQDYKAANDLLQDDIYALQAATQRMSNYLTTLEEKIDRMEKKKK